MKPCTADGGKLVPTGFADGRLGPMGDAVEQTCNANRKKRLAMTGRDDRARIDPAFCCLKTIAWIRKVELRGLANVDWLFVVARAFKLIRLPKPYRDQHDEGDVFRATVRLDRTTSARLHPDS